MAPRTEGFGFRPDSFGLFGAVSYDLGGAGSHFAVEDVPRGAQVQKCDVVAKFAFPDRTALRGSYKPELLLPGLAPRVLGANGELLGLVAKFSRHLRREGNVEDEGV